MTLADAPLVFLVGANGVGKTNLLEALSMLSGGRGLRGAAMADLQRHGSGADPKWVVNAEISARPLRHKITQALTQEGRVTRLNQRAATGVEIANLLPIIALTPVEDSLFRGPAEDRRGLLDKFTMTMEPSHRSQLGAYTKALRERNALLRADGPLDPTWMTALETAMAAHGVAVAAARRTHLARLASAVTQSRGPFPAATLALEGAMEAALQGQVGAQVGAQDGGQDAASVEADWQDKWRASRAEDLAAGRTLHGPHRSDLNVIFSAKNVPANLCSTGEQKALLISLFLGQARLLAAAGKRPLLLLDEVAAHLDADRREALMGELLELPAQSWITGTDLAALQTPKTGDKSLVFHVKTGSVTLGI